jgi:prepilin signal peptidase PulO-like enzyme (type II secretory pathway)
MVPVAIAYAAFLVAIAAYDMQQHRVPNLAIYPAIGVAFGLAFLRPDRPWWDFVLAGAAAASLFVVIDLVSGGGMGMGDAKLAAFIGLMTGWPGVLVAGFVAFAAGAAVGLLLIATGRLGRRDPMPFAPALAVGAMIAAIAGRQLTQLLWPGLAG